MGRGRGSERDPDPGPEARDGSGFGVCGGAGGRGRDRWESPSAYHPAMRLILRLLVTAVALYTAAAVVTGFEIGNWTSLFALAVIVGLVNALVRPLVKLLACGLIVLTLGLFIFVINALMLMLAGWIGLQFGLDVRIDGFWPALLASLIVSVVSLLLSLVVPEGGARHRAKRAD